MLFAEEFEEDEEQRFRMTLAKTGALYLIFLLPIAYVFFVERIKVALTNPYAWVSVIVHEFGHFLFRLSGSRYLEVLGGTGLEYALPLLIILLCAKSKRSAVIAMIFIACIGTELPYTANYMETASHPAGYSYLSHAPMTKDNHDWYYLLSRWKMLGQETRIGSDLRRLGEALMLTGIIGSTVGLALMVKRVTASFFLLLALGSLVSAIYFILMGMNQPFMYSIFLSMPATIAYGLEYSYLDKKIFKGKKAGKPNEPQKGDDANAE